MADSEAFLSRWARRKAEARREAEREPPAEAAEPGAEGDAAAAPSDARDTPPDEETKRQWIAELEKVEVDKLTYDDDFSVFMKSWVPEGLRQKALRKLWTTNPALCLPDGLDDYCEDYTDAAKVVANLKSSWLPGKGYSWLDELAEKADAAADDGAPADESASAAPAGDGPQAEPADAAEAAEEPAEGEAPGPDDDDQPTARPEAPEKA